MKYLGNQSFIKLFVQLNKMTFVLEMWQAVRHDKK